MIDPISITGLILTISHTLSVLYTYGRNVKDAKSDIGELTNELLVLQGVFKQVQDRTSSSTALVGTGKDSLYLLRSTKQSLEFLLYKLETPSSKIEKMIQYAKWPLHKDEVSNHLKRFERLKSLLILVSLTEDSEMIFDAIQSIRPHLTRSSRGSMICCYNGKTKSSSIGLRLCRQKGSMVVSPESASLAQDNDISKDRSLIGLMISRVYYGFWGNVSERVWSM